MKIEKLPSGSYRIRKQYKAKQYQVVLDYKPTQKQAMELMTEMLRGKEKCRDSDMTFYEAYLDYISIKSNILSPSTIRGYISMINNVSEAFKNMMIYDIDNVDVQRFINNYSPSHSPKSVKNMYGFIAVILKTYRPDIVLNVNLPQKIKKEPYIPTDEEVKAIMDEIRGTEYYVPTCLAALGMRKSEIVALTVKDLDADNVLHINKAKVKDKDGKIVLKTTKTEDSTRDIYLPEELADIIRKQGYIYRGYPDCITRNLGRVQEELGIEHFPLHKLRHFFVSYAHNELHLSDKQIMEAGGWKSTNVMQNVYNHSMKENEAKKKLASSMGGLF